MSVFDHFSSGPMALTAMSIPSPTLPVEDARKQKNPGLATETSRTGASTNLLVFVSAKCLGHLGFALSLIAVWLGWILPASWVALASPPAPAEVKAPKPKRLTKSPRRLSVPPASTSVTAPQPPHRPHPIRRVSAPVDLTPILSTHAVEIQPTRRVYFADMPIVSPFLRRNTTPESPTPKTPIMFHSIQQVVSSGSRPASPALPVDSNHASGDAGSILETTQESDTSRPPSRTSLFRTSVGFQKLKFGIKPRSESVDRENDRADQNSIASADTAGSDKSSRRFSCGFSLTRPRNFDLTIEPSAPSLSLRRGSSPIGPGSSPARSASHLPSASDLLSPTFLSRKAQKRISAPIPRTMPYGAPYFATPPILLDDTDSSTHQRTDCQLDPDTSYSPKAFLDSDLEVSRGRSIKRIPLNNSLQAVPQRRSASLTSSILRRHATRPS